MMEFWFDSAVRLDRTSAVLGALLSLSLVLLAGCGSRQTPPTAEISPVIFRTINFSDF
jgi:hypothetical protein